MMKLKKINKTVTVEFTLEEAIEYNRMCDRNTMVKGIPTENGNKCPSCGTEFVKHEHFCPLCGQKVMYVESDVIPL